jgi:5S rRNA maturation endonuclease (ribonuclease M5)/G:T-mismatch repair DNA endonuclease (very short patch repair protein)
MIEKVLEDIGISGNVHGEELLTLCPLHNDHDPSLSINLRSGLINCLPAGTTVIAEREHINQYGKCVAPLSKKIEEIKIGDRVLTYNCDNGSKEMKTVTKIFSRRANDFVTLFLSNGNKLRVTEEHPIAVNEKGKIEWIDAGKIILDQELLQYKYTGLTVRISGLKGAGKREVGDRCSGKTYEQYYGEERASSIKKQQSDSANIRNKNPEYIKKCSIARLKYINDVLFTDDNKGEFLSHLHRNLASMNESPNKSETRLINILSEICPGEFEYNGDGRVMMLGGRYSPDFVNVNGKKKLIEFFGCYHHGCEICKNGKYVNEEIKRKNENRLRVFKKYGWETLVIWEHDIRAVERVKKIISNFLFNPKITLEKVVKIEKDNEEEMVYNLEVEDNNNYFAYGILVHNCLGSCGRGWTLFQFVKEVEKLGLSGGSIKKIKEYKFKFDKEAFVNLPLACDNKYLLGRNLTDEDIVKWDIRFGGASIVIPVYTKRKRLLGAVYRMLIPGFEPRYMNQVGKGHLFGADHFIRGEDDTVIVVEGPMDCINMHKMGFANTVATLGIQVTPEQLTKVKRLANNVFLLFDKDENNAGQKTTLKVAEFLLGINDIRIPDYSFYLSKDPGEMEKEEVEGILKSGFSYLTWKLANMSRLSAEKAGK